MRHVFRAAAWIVIAVFPAALAAQTTTATIRGVVHDPQGAPVPAATVVVNGRGTGLTRTVQTATDGSFVLASLPPALMDLTVSARGFAAAKRSGLLLEVGQTATVDIALTVAGPGNRGCGGECHGCRHLAFSG
jgi:hypothetical protein